MPFRVNLTGVISSGGTGLTPFVVPAATGTDTSAIDTALSNLTANGSGVLRFTGGSYSYASPRIRFTTSNTRIEAAGTTTWTWTDNTKVWAGVLLIDGGYSSGEISNVTINAGNMTFNDAATLSANNPSDDPLGDMPYSSMRGNLMVRGVNNWTVNGGTYQSSQGWAIHIARSRNGTFKNATVTDSEADGLHIDYGCSNITVQNNTFSNLNDDPIAVGFTGAASTGITIDSNIIRNVGGKVVVYGAASGTNDNITISNIDFDGGFLSGIAVSALGFSGNLGSPITGGTIGTINITGGTIKNAGMFTGRSRGVDQSHGILIDPVSGSIGSVIMNGVTITQNRNAFVFVAKGTLSQVSLTNMTFGTQSALGAGGSATVGGGNNTTPITTSAICLIGGATQTITNCTLGGSALPDYTRNDANQGTLITSDAFTRSNGAMGSTPEGYAWGTVTGAGGVATISGNKAVFTSGNSYPISVITNGSAVTNFDFAVDLTLGGTAMYVLVDNDIIATSNGQLYLASSTPQNYCNFTSQSGTKRFRIKRQGPYCMLYVDTTLTAMILLPLAYAGNTKFGVGVFGTSNGGESFDNVTLRTGT